MAGKINGGVLQITFRNQGIGKYKTSYVTMQLQCIEAFGGLQAKVQQMKVVLCCLDGENVVGSRKDPGFLAYSY